jgi:hypothetical protein
VTCHYKPDQRFIFTANPSNPTPFFIKDSNPTVFFYLILASLPTIGKDQFNMGVPFIIDQIKYMLLDMKH